MNRPGRTFYFLPVQKDPVAIAGDGRIQFPFFISRRELKRVTFDFHLPAPHRVAADHAGVGNDFTGTGQPELALQMFFRRHGWGKTLHAFDDLHDTLLAFALLAAGRWHMHAERFGVIEQRRTRRDAGSQTVEMQFDTHATGFVRMTQVSIINAFLNSGNDGVRREYNVLFSGAFTLRSELPLLPFGDKSILKRDENITFLPRLFCPAAFNFHLCRPIPGGDRLRRLAPLRKD